MKLNARAGGDPCRCERRRWVQAGLAALTVLLASAAGAAQAAAAPALRERDGAEARALRYVRLLGALSVGKGLRFNNPYRLATPLGDTAESVSHSAAYLDVGLAALLPAVPRLEHGIALDALVALEGIGQLGLTPSYLLLFEPRPSLGLRGRLGLPLVVAPDASIGLEAGVGAQLPVAYGFGLTAELVGTVFFGAATEQKTVTTIPMLALQLGLYFDERVIW